MTRLYLIAAIVGGTLFVCQFVLGLLGVGHDVDHDSGGHDGHGHHGHDKGSLFWGVLSIRALIAALTAFGLAGMAASRAGGGWPLSLAAAGGVGFVAMLMVAGSLQLMNRMTDDGTERIADARGASGTVYLSIPGDRAGVGKVHLDLQNRTLELQAVTYQNTLAAGTKIIVTDVIGTDTVEVIAVPQMGHQYEPALA